MHLHLCHKTFRLNVIALTTSPPKPVSVFLFFLTLMQPIPFYASTLQHSCFSAIFFPLTQNLHVITKIPKRAAANVALIAQLKHLLRTFSIIYEPLKLPCFSYTPNYFNKIPFPSSYSFSNSIYLGR